MHCVHELHSNYLLIYNFRITNTIHSYVIILCFKGHLYNYLRVRTEGAKPLEINKLFQRRRFDPVQESNPALSRMKQRHMPLHHWSTKL